MTSAAAARRDFGDLLVRFDLGEVDHREIVGGAADLLVAGFDGPAGVELASFPLTRTTSPWETDPLIAAARSELGMPVLPPHGMQIRAAHLYARRWKAGEITPRQLSSWAHSAVGHDGAPALEDLVSFDDVLDDRDENDTVAVHAELAPIVEACLALPDPWAIS